VGGETETSPDLGQKLRLSLPIHFCSTPSMTALLHDNYRFVVWLFTFTHTDKTATAYTAPCTTSRGKKNEARRQRLSTVRKTAKQCDDSINSSHWTRNIESTNPLWLSHV